MLHHNKHIPSNRQVSVSLGRTGRGRTGRGMTALPFLRWTVVAWWLPQPLLRSQAATEPGRFGRAGRPLSHQQVRIFEQKKEEKYA
jgi:hypothetical protein